MIVLRVFPRSCLTNLSILTRCQIFRTIVCLSRFGVSSNLSHDKYFNTVWVKYFPYHVMEIFSKSSLYFRRERNSLQLQQPVRAVCEDMSSDKFSKQAGLLRIFTLLLLILHQQQDIIGIIVDWKVFHRVIEWKLFGSVSDRGGRLAAATLNFGDTQMKINSRSYKVSRGVFNLDLVGYGPSLLKADSEYNINLSKTLLSSSNDLTWYSPQCLKASELAAAILSYFIIAILD